MRDTWPRLKDIAFPAIERDALDTLQLNLGYLCNLSCTHCHVNAGPRRTELMGRDTMALALKVAERFEVRTLDLTGGSPEMNPDFRWLVDAAVERGLQVMDRLNPTIIEEPGYEWVAEYLAARRVEAVASLPCYSQANVDAQRGKGVFESSIRALQRINALGYGQPGSGLELNLVYNPGGAFLPPDQVKLEADYKRLLGENFGIVFNHLYALANMPIQRFGSMLISKGQFDTYLATLQGAHRDENLAAVMCRSLLSVDYRGYLYDCDFNQMLDLPAAGSSDQPHLRDLLTEALPRRIAVAGHCYGCTAGQGSSCGGALV
ncbi:arsenosugar biosynthesis radical SAM (seleno)protein ArsS [Aquimonas sp.]|jgi:radical SAM/Cys-rich protein|uniref:arsenosugar biosynthesis radical SAM (seleno)protein ArsS n=1 Tax=Aquimonas sp. TaxID=1872588 RepID=UPI0037BEDACC